MSTYVFTRITSAARRDVILMMDSMRRIYPELIVWMEPDPKVRDNPDPEIAKSSLAIFVQDAYGGPRYNLSAMEEWVHQLKEKWVWIEHARALQRVTDIVAVHVYKNGKELCQLNATNNNETKSRS